MESKHEISTCGHAKYDTRFDCVGCLQYTVNVLNERLSKTTAGNTSLEAALKEQANSSARIFDGVTAELRKTIEALQSQLAESRSQIEAAQNFAAQLESNIKFLNERVDKAEAQLADYGKPVTDEERRKHAGGYDGIFPLYAEPDVSAILASRAQSKQPVSERSAGE